MGDVNFFKIIAMTLAERLQKFAIKATETAGSASIKDAIDFAMRIAKLESKKNLCRELEQELVRMEGCEKVVVLFNEKASRQLYTIAFAEDDDYANT